MENKKFSRLRLLVVAGSLGGFVGGWALFAQAANPNAGAALTPVVTQGNQPVSSGSGLVTVPSTYAGSSSLTNGRNQSTLLPGFQTRSRLRTGGS